MPIDPEILHQVPFFQLMDRDELAELATHLDEDAFFRGQVIFKSGDPGGTLHIILVGKVRTSITGPNGQSVTIDELGPGEVFGDLSLLDKKSRSATATALTEVRTVVVDQDDLRRLFARKPDAALDMLAAVGQRVRNTEGMLYRLVTKNPNEAFEERLSFGDRMADAVARFGGSWAFVLSFMGIMLVWIALNGYALTHPFDPPPFIGLNLILSMLAALQAPIIMMSQNRQDAKDRLASELDYQVNVKAELEIVDLHQKVEAIQAELSRLSKGSIGKDGQPSARA